PALPPPRDGPRRLLRLPVARAPGVAEAVRPLRQAVRRGLPARAVQPPLRAPPAGLLRTEAPRGRLGRDLRRLDDAGPRLAPRVRRLARRPGQAGVLRPHA